MGIWNGGSACERIGGIFIVLQLCGVDKTKIAVNFPVLWIVLDAEHRYLNRSLRHPCAIWLFGRQKIGAELIRHGQFWIERSCDLEELREQSEAACSQMMLAAEILHRACRVNVGQETVVAKAQALECF